MGIGFLVHRIFYFWIYKEYPLQNYILIPKDEGYNIILEDRWLYGKMDGLDFVRILDPWGGNKIFYFYKFWRNF